MSYRDMDQLIAVGKIAAELDSIQKMTEGVYDLNTLLDRIRSADMRIQNLHVDAEAVTDLRVKLCCIGRNAAMALPASRKFEAYLIISSLLSEFNSIPSLRLKLADDRGKLEKLTAPTYAPSSVSITPRRVFAAVAAALVVGLGVYFLSLDGQEKKEPAPKQTYVSSAAAHPAASAPKPTPTLRPVPKPTCINTYNGMMFIKPDYECVCPFEIRISSAADCYVYLKYRGAPAYSTQTRQLKPGASDPTEDDISFMVKAGFSVDIDVPIGVYKLYYVTGHNFYGTKELFGANTQCYTSDELLTFYADTEYYQGHTITLKASPSGNFDTESISEAQFPTR